MRITQIIQGIHNPTAGPTYCVARLAEELHRLGDQSSVLALGDAPSSWPYAVPLTVHSGLLERHTGLSLALLRDVRRLSRVPGILHGNGIWRAANLFPLFTGDNTAAKLVCSPHGMLSPWSLRQKAALKRPFWRLLQKPAFERCDCYHVTAPIEYDDIRRAGLRAPVAVIPLGIDVPALDAEAPRRRRLVFLSRIDPKKGLNLLLPAWSALARDFPAWDLVIAGPLDGDYAAYIQALAARLDTPRISFAGRVLGESKRELLAGSSLFVLPTYSENFGIAVAEAMAHGLPVITTTETPWTEVRRRNCGWCIRPDRRALEEALRDAMGRAPAELRDMGANGRRWMQTDYAWERIAALMKQTYEWLVHGTARPGCVVES